MLPSHFAFHRAVTVLWLLTVHCKETPEHEVFASSSWRSKYYQSCWKKVSAGLCKCLLWRWLGRRLVTQANAGGRYYSDPCEPFIEFSMVFKLWFWPGLAFSVSVGSFFVWTMVDLNIIFVCGSIDCFDCYFLFFDPLVRNNSEEDDLNRDWCVLAGLPVAEKHILPHWTACRLSVGSSCGADQGKSISQCTTRSFFSLGTHGIFCDKGFIRVLAVWIDRPYFFQVFKEFDWDQKGNSSVSLRLNKCMNFCLTVGWFICFHCHALLLL